MLEVGKMSILTVRSIILWTHLTLNIYAPFMLRSAVGMTHSMRSDLWWAIPFRILLDKFWDTLWIPHDQASPSQTHRYPGVSGSRQSDHIQPTGIHGLCFGSCFSGPLPLRSLILGPLSRVHLGESLVVRLYSEIDHTYLSIEAQCVSHHYPRWTATLGSVRLFHISSAVCGPIAFKLGRNVGGGTPQELRVFVSMTTERLPWKFQTGLGCLVIRALYMVSCELK